MRSTNVGRLKVCTKVSGGTTRCPKCGGTQFFSVVLFTENFERLICECGVTGHVVNSRFVEIPHWHSPIKTGVPL